MARFFSFIAASGLAATIALACLRLFQRRYWHFDPLGGRDWILLWRHFTANEFIFDTVDRFIFLASFPMTAIFAVLAVAPLAAALQRSAAMIAVRVDRPQPETTQNPLLQALDKVKIPPDPTPDPTADQIRAMADDLFRILFPGPPNAVIETDRTPQRD